MSTFAILINPNSGAYSEDGIQKRIIEVLNAEGHRYTVLETDAETGARNAAAKALNAEPDGIIVCGGDGTMFEVINVVHGSAIPIIIVPCGTGNDFFKMLRLPKDPIEALKVQLRTKARKVDCGRVNDMYFMNVTGSGFDAEVLRAAEKYKPKYNGIRPYFFGLVDAVKHYRPAKYKIRIDNGAVMETRNAIFSIGNGSYIGGGMKAVPGAQIDDGYFDLVLVKPVAKAMILPLVVFFILGLHVRIGLAQMYKCKRVEIESENMVMDIDGELIDMDRAVVEIIPGGVTMRIP